MRSRITIVSPVLILLVSPVLILLGSPLAAQSAREVQAFEVKASALQRHSQVQGEVLPLRTMRVIPRVSGYLTKVHVREGTVVPRGAVLATIAAPELDRDKAVAEAMVERAEALLTVARSATLAEMEAAKVAAADHRAARSESEVANSALQLSQANYARAKALHAGRAATEEEWEAAQLELTRSKSGLLAAQAAEGAAAARVAQAAAEVALRQAERARAAAGVSVAKAEAERAAVLLGFATLENPYASGLVTRQFVDAGTLAMANKTELLELMDTSKVRIRFGVPQVDAAHVKPGAAVTIVIPDSPRADVTATVTRVAGAITADSRTMFAEVELDNASGEWVPGSIVKIDLEVESASAAIVIPSRAVVNIRAASFVWIVDAGKARRVRIKPGNVVGTGSVHILSGIENGALVLTSGFSGLRGGEALTVQKVER